MDKVKALGQYFTPTWASEMLVAEHLPDLSMMDMVLEPSCGPGSFLLAVPDHVPAVGVELDPELAARARAATGREIICGDFLTAKIPVSPTVVLGNPPYSADLMRGFINRAFELLPNDGRCALLLPVYALQTPSYVTDLAKRWFIQQSLVPRTLFPRLRYPLAFATLTKGRRGLVGFSLYHEAHAVSRLQARYRALLEGGEGSTWKAVVRAAMEQLGGEATLQEIYREVEGARPTTNRFWQPKVRQVVQLIATRRGPATWALPKSMPMAA